MKLPFRNGPIRRDHRAGSRVKVCDAPPSRDLPNRRTVITVIAGRVAALPAACLLTAAAPSHTTHERRPGPQGARNGASPIIRDFADPLIELIRLLHEASEIEHALMLQYLYAAASLKPRYQTIIGYGDPNATDLLGVAIQEMQHLSKVNRFLCALGAAPNLLRQDFPFEPDIYPFAFNLEPLSRKSLAKYVYAEAPAGGLSAEASSSDSGTQLVDRLTEILGSHPRANHIGSLYDAVLSTAEEVSCTACSRLPDLRPWLETLEQIKKEGEEDHFTFFKSLFMGSHTGFEGRSGVWDLPLAHPDYPARPVPTNPSAYVGHHNQIEDTELLALAWLSNLHYWSVLLLLDLGYKGADDGYVELAKVHMTGPLWSLMLILPSKGCGVPFDHLSMGYSPGHDEWQNVRFLERLLGEADQLETLLSDQLPEDFPRSIAQHSLDELAARRG